MPRTLKQALPLFFICVLFVGLPAWIVGSSSFAEVDEDRDLALGGIPLAAS